MTDVLTPDQRKLNMRRIRAKDTKPERVVRRVLHAAGLRYRLHVKQLPGSPDLVFPKYKTVIFVQGCFWHGHGCKRCKTPQTRTDFWLRKILQNKDRDTKNIEKLHSQGWKIIVIWECGIKNSVQVSGLVQKIMDFFSQDKLSLVVIE